MALLLESSSAGDKRDDLSAQAPGIRDCPVCLPEPVVPWSRLAWLTGGVAFLKLSKLLNQEDA
jgi:hypothetical protein